ncbi:SAM-dependent methyltransferase [Sphingosinicella terrae]|uniref:SAM-dependent methyltransferase n=1 Tax=Sphingosinicella terrae TaxID=2172047 RepID=UPI0013B39871|nr:methyltransferase domain-containing protein [Sphingosinicella terrae]
MRASSLLAALLLLSGCTFGGSGIAPFTPAPAAPSEDELEVPYVPTPRPAVEAMLDMAAIDPSDYLIDLGSGDGRIPIMAAQRGARALGVDIDPARVAEAGAAARLAQVENRVLFRRQDLFVTPLRDATIVALYLMPELNLRLRPRLLTELRPGTRVVSHNFDMGDWRPDARREVGNSRLFLWVVPAPAEGRWRLQMADGRETLLELEQRFQDVGGSLDGRPLRDATLSGRHLRFTIDLPEGTRTFLALVEDAAIVPDPQAEGPQDWRAARLP